MDASAQPHQPAAAQAFTLDTAHDTIAWQDDMALGCECANPALQIEMWGHEASAQPLQTLF